MSNSPKSTEKRRTHIKKLSVILAVIMAMSSFLTACTGGEGIFDGEIHQAGQALTASGPTIDDLEYVRLDNGMLMYADNDNLSLFFNPENGEFAVLNKRTGRMWYSNPIDKYDNDLMGGPRYIMFSQIIIDTLEHGRAMSRALSHTASVMRDGLSSEPIANGVTVSYHFPNEGITVPIDLILHPDRFEIRFELDRVQKDEGVTRNLMNISLAPMFGAGMRTDEGFIVVPDGSGAVINFNNNKASVMPFDEPIYGQDPGLFGPLRPALRQRLNLPVFGIENNGESMLAVISNGAQTANIRATTSGQFDVQNSVHAHFRLYASSMVTIGRATAAIAPAAERFDFDSPLALICSVYYFFLEEGGYDAMARKYGEILRAGREQQDFTKPPFYVSLFGGMRKRESVMGFQMYVVREMTTFEQAEAIIDELKLRGIENIVLVYTNWSSNEIRGRMMDDVRPARQLGGTSGLNSLIDKTQNESVELFLSYNPFKASRSGRGFYPMLHAARAMDTRHLQVNRYWLSTLIVDERNPSYTYPNLNFLRRNAISYLESMNDIAAGIYFPEEWNQLYADHNLRRTTTRYQALNMLRNNVFNETNHGFMSDAANDYIIIHSRHILNAPMTSSNHDLVDFSIPFYAIAVGGIAEYSYPFINFATNTRSALLRSIETGAGLSFRWVYNDPAIFIDTVFSRYFATSFHRWIDEAELLYQEFSEAFSQIGSSVLVGHERLTDSVRMSTFKNGARVIVNYGSSDFVYQGQVVGPMDWLVIPA